MKAHLVYHVSDSTGYAIIGLYLNHKAAIRSAMRKVYQLMDVHSKTKKLKNEWTWVDDTSSISVIELPVVDFKDLNGESPLPQFLRYKDYLEDMSTKDLEKQRKQAINRKKLIERFKNLKRKN